MSMIDRSEAAETNGEVPKPTSETRHLPVPQSNRWQPLRSGLINLFHYADQQFWYEDGRLLLRGNNGTGKSRVLALQLPFLFDAELSPTRMEPDRSPSKRPEWNLLLGGKHRDRLGYTWIEFGCLNPNGQPEYFTLGCGLHAVQHRGGIDAWFFTTTERVDASLELIRDSVPLSKSRLGEALGEAGMIYRTRGDYRRAVDEKLFRLGARYRPLVDLLIQLRVPQLSRDFDEKRMSAQLSDALPPLSPDVLSQVADAMQELDEQRERLEERRHSEAGVRSFRQQYRHYLRIALKRRITDLIAMHNRYDRTLRTINDHRRQLDEATERHDEVRSNEEAADTEHKRATEILGTLRSRPEMDDARRLDDLRSDCTRLDQQCERAAQSTRQAEASIHESAKTYREEKQRAEWDRNRTETRIDELQRRELPPAIKQPFRAVASALVDAPSPEKSLAAVDRAVETSVRAAKTLRSQERELQKLRDALQRQLHRQGDLESRLEADRQTLTERQEAFTAARQLLRDRLVQWFDAAASLARWLPERADWIDALNDGEEKDAAADADAADTSPREAVDEWIAAAWESAFGDLQQRRMRLETQRETLSANLLSLEEELQKLVEGAPLPPAAPIYRGEGVREDRAGGPLYELCEFADTVPDAERAHWEAALESAGLLDAWVTPDGDLESPTLSDVTLLASQPVADENSRLSRVLRPAESLPEGMPRETIERILASIGCGKGAAAAWVDRDGSWQLGPARGAWTKKQVEHVGAAAREQRRQQQIQRLEAEIVDTRAAIEAVDRELKSVDQQRAALSDQHRAVPTDERFHQALAARREAETHSLRAEQALGDQLQLVGKARSEVDAAHDRFHRDAADLGLSPWVDRLDELDDALVQFGQRLELLRRDLESFRQRLASLQRAKDARDSAGGWLQKEQAAEKEFQDQRTQKRAQLETLEASVGKDVQEILEEIAQQETFIGQVETRLKALQQELRQCAERKARLEGRLEESETILEGHENDRQARIAQVEAFADLGLAAQALEDNSSLAEKAASELPETPWSPTRAVEIARQIRDDLRDTPESDSAWNTAQNELQEQFRALEQALLPTGVTPQFQTRDELSIVAIPYKGVVCTPSELGRQLYEEVSDREMLITQRERVLFEERLIGDIAEALHRNIREAHELCQRMNHEVESRPMSSGMRLRFRWHADPEGGDELKIACRSLLKKPSAMSEGDRTALGQFLQQRIAEAHAADEVGTWQQHMADALDYRRWFVFEIQRETDGRWQRLTRRTHGTGSGGERAVALILPMLAALAAYYQSADETAPRMILMDEAFVGIDNEMRAKFMDLMVQFELGFIMTSEREWGCYPTMPALAIYHLSTRRGVDAVLATRWVWNGNGRVRSDVHEPPRQQDLLAETDGS